MDKMKAVICTNYGPPEVLQYREVEKPVPQDQEVLIKIRATTVTVADYRVRSFTVPAAFWIPARITLGIRKPKKNILGVELAGEVEAVGQAVKRFKPGDSVFAATLTNFGAYAQYICLPEAGPIALKPPTISYEQAAAIPIGARTALHYLKKAAIQPGQNVLIYGASGSVGTYALQLAKLFGAKVTGVCSTRNVELVKSLGADQVIDYTQVDFTQSGVVYDVIFEAVDKSSFSDCVRVLKKDGLYVNVTTPVPSIPMQWALLTSRKKVLLSQNVPDKVEDLLWLSQLVETGQLKVVIDRSYPFEQIVEAHRYVEQGHKRGNVVITL